MKTLTGVCYLVLVIFIAFERSSAPETPLPVALDSQVNLFRSCTNLLFVHLVPSYSEGLQLLLSSIMVSNPQERPNINWVLDQVQDLQSRSPNTQTNMV